MFTEFFDVTNGVRQGDSISPTLFSIYINDLVAEMKLLNCGVDIGTYILYLLLYADDLVLIAPNEQSLQKMIDCLHTWSVKWRVSINFNKSNIIHFRKIRKCETEVQFVMGEQEINKTPNYKYLGIILDEHLKFTKATDTIAASAQRALGSIVSKYKSYRDMGYKTYSTLFSAGVLPILNYCCPAWYFCDNPKLEQVQTRAMRVCLGVHRFAPINGLIGDKGWLPLNHMRQIELIRYWNRLINMDNDKLTKKIFTFDYNSKKPKTWCSSIEQVFKYLNMHDTFENVILCPLPKVENNIKDIFHKEWKAQIDKKPKLRFYPIFKTIPEQENYVIMNLAPIERSYLSQLRFGILQPPNMPNSQHVENRCAL